MDLSRSCHCKSQKPKNLKLRPLGNLGFVQLESLVMDLQARLGLGAQRMLSGACHRLSALFLLCWLHSQAGFSFYGARMAPRDLRLPSYLLRSQRKGVVFPNPANIP